MVIVGVVQYPSISFLCLTQFVLKRNNSCTQTGRLQVQIHGWVIPKTLKIGPNSSLLDTQHYEVEGFKPPDCSLLPHGRGQMWRTTDGTFTLSARINCSTFVFLFFTLMTASCQDGKM